jgi:hypothetical protein
MQRTLPLKFRAVFDRNLLHTAAACPRTTRLIADRGGARQSTARRA